MSSRIFSFFRKSETHRIWRCSFFVRPVLRTTGETSQERRRRWSQNSEFTRFGTFFHNLGRTYEYGLAAWQICLFVACLACFLSLANAK